jgi:hypothetical protein
MSVNQSDENNPEFETYLTRAMRPADPPAGFAARLLAKAAAETTASPKVVVMHRRTPAWLSGAIAAALLTGTFVAEHNYERRQQQRAQQAQQQFNAAMRITGETLDQTRQQLQQAGIQFGD